MAINIEAVDGKVVLHVTGKDGDAAQTTMSPNRALELADALKQIATAARPTVKRGIGACDGSCQGCGSTGTVFVVEAPLLGTARFCPTCLQHVYTESMRAPV